MRCSQRCSQRVFVLKTKAPQVADLRRQVELEGIEPSTSSMPWQLKPTCDAGRFTESDSMTPGSRRVVTFTGCQVNAELRGQLE